MWPIPCRFRFEDTSRRIDEGWQTLASTTIDSPLSSGTTRQKTDKLIFRPFLRWDHRIVARKFDTAQLARSHRGAQVYAFYLRQPNRHLSDENKTTTVNTSILSDENVTVVLANMLSVAHMSAQKVSVLHRKLFQNVPDFGSCASIAHG
jgi:hypothetical protein